MRYVINSRKLGKTFEFWVPPTGGYIRLESPGKEGTLGYQICEGGGFMGETISYSFNPKDPDSIVRGGFQKVCKKWHKQYLKRQRGFK